MMLSCLIVFSIGDFFLDFCNLISNGHDASDLGGIKRIESASNYKIILLIIYLVGYPLSNSERLEEAKTNIANILKMEDYKLDSGELFQAFKEAGGEMSDFSPALEELSKENQIKTDSDGNIMTVQDYDRKKSQMNEDPNEPKEKTTEEVMEAEEDASKENEDMESIIKLKEETDTWLIEQLKNKSDNGSEGELRAEVAELRDRVQKLESIIKNLTKAFE